MTIGVADSGVGGLTVLSALRRAFPRADLLYLGDTARKSPMAAAAQRRLPVTQPIALAGFWAVAVSSS